MNMLFPALLLGGPPHSGKSTLLYRLSRALDKRDVQHYALRASPDGEGNWSMEIPQTLVTELRTQAKQAWTPRFAEHVSRDVDRRHLPLLVDAGGEPSPETERILAACTHTVLLAANTADLTPWRALAARLGKPVIAELRSELHGEQLCVMQDGVLHGTITGLDRNLSSSGPCFHTLLDQVATLFAYPSEQLYHAHLALTNLDLVINIERAIHPLPAHNRAHPWQPSALPKLLSSLPQDTPIGIYGRGPNWLYAALAAFTRPTPQVFTATRGWVTPPPLKFAAADGARLRWHQTIADAQASTLSFVIPGGYLDYHEASNLPIPVMAEGRGVIIGGKLPNWLYAALARAYDFVPWLGVYQPQKGVIVVRSNEAAIPVGALLPMNV